MSSRAVPDNAGFEGFEHHGVLFHSARELCDVVVPRIRAGLASGDHVVVALRPGHATAVRAALTPSESDSVHFVDHDTWYEAPGRTLAALHRLTLLHPDRHITVVGEPALPLDNPLELREWHRLDSVLGASLAGSRLRLMCLHDTDALPRSVLERVWHTHPVMIIGGTPRHSPDYRDAAAYSAADALEPLPPPDGPVESLEIVPDLPALRDELTALAKRLGAPRERVNDLVVAVNEMAANVLEHGAGKGMISLWLAPGRLMCDVFDEGGDLTDPLSGYFPADALSVRGYGLWITRQICDFMEVRGNAGGSLVRLHFKA
ncbi:anti-sigma factor RsbA family regulatory protein [Marinactinospora thermotolerans]|nr:sensor histidine kinase [Marinactinospora thermotolerans]